MSQREYDPNDSIDFIFKTAPKYAEAKGQRVMLQEFRKSKKALLMKEHESKAVAVQEREAYSHPDYVELLKGLQAAVELETTLEWQMKAAEARIEIWRTTSANNRRMDRAAT